MTKHSGISQTDEDKQADLFGGTPPPTEKAKKKARRAKAPPKPPKTPPPVRVQAAAPDALLNVREAAARLGLSKSTVDKMRGAGKGPRFIKSTDRAVRYDPKDLDAWIAARRRGDACGP
ncbi:MAG: helix-turn-helix domain-containing protein [Hyphomonadaceae bacterium]|nr:helix-turn-helix domain-containing protein [Hyphomonadaceae bacterium]